MFKLKSETATISYSFAGLQSTPTNHRPLRHMEVELCDKVIKVFKGAGLIRTAGSWVIFSSSWPLALSCSHVKGKCRSTPRTGGEDSGGQEGGVDARGVYLFTHLSCGR